MFISFKFSLGHAEISYVMRTFILYILFISLAPLAACTKGQPDFKILDEDSIPRPLFSNSTTKSITWGSTTTDLPNISGTCDPKISSLKVQLVNSNRSFTNLSDLCDSPPSINCTTDGTFSFTLNSLSDLGFNPLEDGIYEIQVQGVTAGGTSKPSLIRVTYSTKIGSARPTQITSGTTHRDTSTSGFSADIRITGKSNAQVGPQTTSSDFYLKTDGTANGISAHIGIKNNYGN